jgi:hypothetical protein
MNFPRDDLLNFFRFEPHHADGEADQMQKVWQA